MDLLNEKNKNNDSIQKGINGKSTKEETSNIHNDLKILARIIARDIYNKQKGDISNK